MKTYFSFLSFHISTFKFMQFAVKQNLKLDLYKNMQNELII